MKLKVEINTEEHFTVYGHTSHEFSVRSRWFSGAAAIRTYCLEELLATKLRALYQRRKGRDLFDFERALGRREVDAPRILDAFSKYMEHQGERVTRAQFEANLDAKLKHPDFLSEVKPLLASGTEWDMQRAATLVLDKLISRLPGEPWRGVR
jgi:predicted nucleotidyltransferase component of viral defense system